MIADNSTTEHIKKKAKTSHNIAHMAYGSATFQISPPTGLIWSNNSCAYDSVFTILYSFWRNNPTHWKQFFHSINCNLLEEICNGFNDHSYNQTSLESVRDTFRMGLDDLHLAGLCWGRYTSVVRLLEYMFKAPTEMVSSQLTCREGHSCWNMDRAVMRACAMHMCVCVAIVSSFVLDLSFWVHSCGTESI
jgi:hypothetical protein